MTYCNMQIAGKNRRKHKQPSVSLWEIEKSLRLKEIEHYKDNPDEPTPVVFKGGQPVWPQKF